MTTLMDYNLVELTEIICGMEQPKFRAKQLYDAMHNGKDYTDKINVPAKLLDDLKSKNFILQSVKIDKSIGSSDKSKKFLFKLTDGNIVEGVVMHYKHGNTLCISTQVGCKMKCHFCASGLNKFVRNLSAGEILGQVVAVNRLLGGTVKERKITNLVLMGTGEPLDNFDNVAKFLNLITNDDGLNFSVRNISLSTCGIPHKIEQLADLGYNITLCISLHAPNDTIRKSIMPIARKYSIASVLDSAKYYNQVTSRRLIIEYVLIDQINNSISHAKQLVELLKDIQCHVNLIKLNEIKEQSFKTPSKQSCEDFLNFLLRNKISATIRRNLADDIEGACGMLRNKEIKKGDV